MPILIFLILFLSLDAHAAPTAGGIGLDAQVQSLRMDRLEHIAALAASGQATGAESELEDLYARFRNGRINTGDVAGLVRQLIRAGLPKGAVIVLNGRMGKRLVVESKEALWFELAEAWHLRDYRAEADAALSHIEPLRRGVRFERLGAKLAIQAGRREEAITLLSALNRKGQATALERYNLAILSMAGTSFGLDKEPARILSNLINTTKPADAAAKNLAAVTLGRVLLDTGDFRSAIQILKQVDHGSIQAHEAHYMLGKAHMAADQPRKAIGLWEQLARHRPTNPFAERAMMTLPSALGALDATGEAVTRIAAIQKRLEAAITDLSGALNELSATDWIDRITFSAGQESLSAKNIAQIPAAAYVVEQISTNRFQTALANAEALHKLKLRDLPEDLQRRRQMLVTAQKAYITGLIRPIVEMRLGMIEHDLLDTRFEYALLLDNQAGQKK